MKIYNLPHDLLPAAAEAPADVLIRPYCSQRNTVKNKIILHRNMLNLLLDGRKTILSATGIATVHHDEIVLLAAGNCLTTEVLSDAGQFRSVIVYFSNAVFSDFLVKYAGALGSPTAPVGPGQSLLTFAKDDFIRNYVTSLDLLLAAGSPLTPALKLLKLEELLLYLFQTARARISTFQPSDPTELALRNVVERHLARPVTVRELAFLCHMSASTFQRRFAAIYGTTPQKWLLHQKMQLAARLLQHLHEHPSDVYQKVGYENHSSFSEAFKKAFGLSPTAFKRQQPALSLAAGH